MGSQGRKAANLGAGQRGQNAGEGQHAAGRGMY